MTRMKCCPCGHWFMTKANHITCRYCRERAKLIAQRKLGRYVAAIVAKEILQ